MILILSSAYVSADLAIEFGKLPPAFLPVGGKRLYEIQIEQLRADLMQQEIYITLPSNYNLSEFERRKLISLNVGEMRINPNKTIGEAVVEALRYLDVADKPLTLLHGDTLIAPLPDLKVCCAVSPFIHDYDWEQLLIQQKVFAFTGFSSFVSAGELMRRLEAVNLDYIKMIREYAVTNHTIVNGWSDFGTSATYHSSKKNLMVLRAFNHISFNRRWLSKRNNDALKISAESNWYYFWPPELRDFLPQYQGLSIDGRSYTIEYLPLSSLADIAVFGHHPVSQWIIIFSRIFEYLSLAKKFCQNELTDEMRKNISKYKKYLWIDKVNQRVKSFSNSFNLDEQYMINGFKCPPVIEMIKICQREILNEPIIPGLWHGDFCLGNILFDFKLVDIKLVDPRGISSSDDLIQDLMYDYAKLAHSLIGLYDFINFNQYKLDWKVGSANIRLEIFCPPNWHSIVEASNIFFSDFYSNGERKVLPGVILLMLSLIPLHYDNKEKQRAFFANALRLFSIFWGSYDRHSYDGT